MKPTFLERFWAKVDTSAGADGCWLWTGAITPEGYGIQGIGTPNGRLVNEYAHRLAYILEHGVPLPPRGGDAIDHLCRVRACLNPKHLELVPQRTNLLRGTHRAAQCQRRQTCVRGHPYSDSYVRPNGWRYCRVCERTNRERRAVTRLPSRAC